MLSVMVSDNLGLGQIADFIGELEAEIQRQRDLFNNKQDVLLAETWR